MARKAPIRIITTFIYRGNSIPIKIIPESGDFYAEWEDRTYTEQKLTDLKVKLQMVIDNTQEEIEWVPTLRIILESTISSHGFRLRVDRCFVGVQSNGIVLIKPWRSSNDDPEVALRECKEHTPSEVTEINPKKGLVWPIIEPLGGSIFIPYQADWFYALNSDIITKFIHQFHQRMKDGDIVSSIRWLIAIYDAIETANGALK